MAKIEDNYKLRGSKIITTLPYNEKRARIFGVTDKKTKKDNFIFITVTTPDELIFYSIIQTYNIKLFFNN